MTAAYRVVGFAGCGFHKRAVDTLAAAAISADVVTLPDRVSFQRYLRRADVRPLIDAHRTSPVVFKLDNDPVAAASLLGGCDELLAHLRDCGAYAPPRDRSSRSPAGVLAYFRTLQREKRFVVWVLWRGPW